MLLPPARLAARGSARRCSHRIVEAGTTAAGIFTATNPTSQTPPPRDGAPPRTISPLFESRIQQGQERRQSRKKEQDQDLQLQSRKRHDNRRLDGASKTSSTSRTSSKGGSSSSSSSSSRGGSTGSRRHATGPYLTEREKHGLEHADLSPLSPKRFWPRYCIPDTAKQIECSFDSLVGGPVTVGWTREFLFVEDKRTGLGRRTLKPVTIRDACDCARCRDPLSGQKTFSTTELPLDLAIAGVRPTEQGLVLTWDNDIPRFAATKSSHANDDNDSNNLNDGNIDGIGGRHETLLPWPSVELALQRTGMEDPSLPRKRFLMRRTGAVFWDCDTLAPLVRRIDYAAYMQDDSPAFWSAVIDLLRLGIVFLTNVPRDPSSILAVVGRIANVRETFYGRTFDVRAKPAAENVAYTAAPLAPHQDLAYLEPQPLIQALHFMDNSCAGGASTFVDGERVGRLLYPFACASPVVAPLADLHVPFHYAKNGFRYFASRRVIDTNEAGFAGIYWSPPFQGRTLVPTRDLRPWIPPARVFEAMLADERAVFRMKMREGDCVLFDNQRVLHGRDAFDPAAGGARWLRGAYIAAEDFLSRAAHIPDGMAEALRGPQPWSPSLAQRQLKQSEWHADTLRRVLEIDPDFLTRQQRALGEVPLGQAASGGRPSHGGRCATPSQATTTATRTTTTTACQGFNIF